MTSIPTVNLISWISLVTGYAVDPAPIFLCALDELEDHGMRGLV
jgi:hypothetical protein